MARNKPPSLFRDAIDTARAAENVVSTSISAIEHLQHESSELRDPETHFESKDIDHNKVLLTGAGLLIVVWAIVGLLYFYFAYLSRYRAGVSPPPLVISRTGNQLPPKPRLQPSPSDDLHELRAREDNLLNHYQWIDRSKKIIGIPIERAIELTAQRGIPPQKAPAGLTLSKPEDGTRLTGFEGKVAPEPR
jgi:hypothetical protein